MKLTTTHELKKKALWVRQTVLEMAVRAQSGHITTAFSQAEMLVALYYGGILQYDPKNPRWEDRDRFILSKGQGGIGTYPILADVGFFPLEELENFTGEGSRLGVHAESNIPGIEVLTGSLGHGLPIASGMAYAARLKGKNWKIFVMLGDGELGEGSNWEALLTIGTHKFSNIVTIVDNNRQSTIGYMDRLITSRDGPLLDPLDKKFEAFGFEARTIDGHNFKDILYVLSDAHTRTDSRPLAVISKTFKGHGSPHWEDKRDWHYRVPAGADLEQIRKDLKTQERELERQEKQCTEVA